MDSSVKINSISIDLAKATNEINTRKCQHFSIRGFVAEIRQRDSRKCWPFPADRDHLEDQSYPLPPLSVPKSRWWHCASCLRDIDAEGIMESSDAMHSKSRVPGEKTLDVNMPGISIKSDRNYLSKANNKKGRKSVGVGNIASGNENMNRREVNHTVSLSKKVRGRSMDAATSGSKNRKLGDSEQARLRSKEKINVSVEITRKGNKEAVDGQFPEALTNFSPSDIAGVVEDTPKAIKNNNVSSENAAVNTSLLEYSSDHTACLYRRKTRKIRLLSDLLGKANVKPGGKVRNEESPIKKEASRGRKRKRSREEDVRLPETTPENNYVKRRLSTIASCDSEENMISGRGSQPSVESQSTDSGSDKDLIKGKQKNRRFQVVDEHLPAVSQENSQKGIQESDGASSFPLHIQGTERKPSLVKKKSKITGGNQIYERKAEGLRTSYMNPIVQSTRDVSKGKGIDPSSSLDKSLDSERCVERYNPLHDDWPVFPYHSNAHERPNTVEMNHFQNIASSSKSNRLPLVIEKRKLGSSAGVVDHSLVPQKDTTSDAYRKGKGTLIQSDHGKEKIPEPIDDIPMEIVELMARNQYERCLPDEEDEEEATKENNTKSSQPQTSTSKNRLLIDLNKTYESEDSSSRQPNVHDKNVRKDEAIIDHSVDVSPFMRSGSGIFPLTREQPSSSIQFSGAGPSGQSFHNFPYVAANQSPHPSSLSVLNAGHYREASHPIWPSSTIQRHQMPVSYNTPHKFMDQSTKVDMLSRDSLSELNLWNFTYVDNGKRKCRFGSEISFSRSLDPSYKESIVDRVSHLDPWLTSNTLTDLSGKSKSMKRPFQKGNQSKEFRRLHSDGLKPLGFDYYSKRSGPAGTSSSSSLSFQREKGFRKGLDLTSDPERFRLLGASDSMKLPLPIHSTDYGNASAMPLKSDSGSMKCSINRNPADFTIPEPGNVYMRKGEDLKVRKRGRPRKIFNLCKQDALKQNKEPICPPKFDESGVLCAYLSSGSGRK